MWGLNAAFKKIGDLDITKKNRVCDCIVVKRSKWGKFVQATQASKSHMITAIHRSINLEVISVIAEPKSVGGYVA